MDTIKLAYFHISNPPRYVKKIDLYRTNKGIRVEVEYDIKAGNGTTKFILKSLNDYNPIFDPDEPYVLENFDFHSHVRRENSIVQGFKNKLGIK